MRHPPVRRRHPRQIMRPAAMAAGVEYAFVYAEPAGTSVSVVTFAGILDGTDFGDVVAACGPGRWHLTLHRMRGDPDPVLFGTWDTTGRWPELANVHGFHASGGIHDLLPDPAAARLADGTYAAHRLVVPQADWGADPHVRAVDWRNPGAECAAAGDWADEEARLKAKKDAELRRILGFD